MSQLSTPSKFRIELWDYSGNLLSTKPWDASLLSGNEWHWSISKSLRDADGLNSDPAEGCVRVIRDTDDAVLREYHVVVVMIDEGPGELSLTLFFPDDRKEEEREALELRAERIISPNLWRQLETPQQAGWLRVALHCGSRSSTARDVFTLDASFVVDEVSFYCALGEAMNGPGGYYGQGLDSMEDCLMGGFGPAKPFRLVINTTADTELPSRPLELLRSHDIDVRVEPAP